MTQRSVNRELEAMISKAASADLRPHDADLLEPSYQESVRRFNRSRAEELREAWLNFYRRMERVHTQLASEHAARARALLEDRGEGRR